VLLCKAHRDTLLEQAKTRPPAVHEPVVYFLHHGSRVKIGWTTNLKRRVRSLALPMSAVAATMPGTRGDEIDLHYRFQAARLPGSEWFEATPELMRLIGSLQGSGQEAG
jgi:hypothetical protein